MVFFLLIAYFQAFLSSMGSPFCKDGAACSVERTGDAYGAAAKVEVSVDQDKEHAYIAQRVHTFGSHEVGELKFLKRSG